jgi:hypothetical protein
MALGEVQDVIDTEAANVRYRELEAKGLTLDEIASTIAEEAMETFRRHTPATDEAGEIDIAQVQRATYGLFWALGELAKVNLGVATSATRQFARELRSAAASDKFWTAVLEVQIRHED